MLVDLALPKVTIDERQTLSEAALDAKQTAEQSKQANDKLEKLNGKKQVPRNEIGNYYF